MWKKLIFGSVFIVGAYYFWTTLDKTPPPPPPVRITYVQSVGQNQNRGNLLGIQPFVLPAHYATEDHFEQLLRVYFERARQEGLIIPSKTIVVLPEYLGTWLVIAHEKTLVYQAKTVDDGLQPLVLSHPLGFVSALINAPDSVTDKVKHAVFSMKAPQMAHIYQSVFSKLANEFQCYIVAGSILLPNPSIRQGNLTTSSGRISNVTAVFKPDGSLYEQLVKKAFPIGDEQPFICDANPAENPVFETEIGRLGVLVCADSWFSRAYQALKAKRADFVAIPSYSLGEGSWGKVWRGYSGAPTPSDAQASIGKITEQQAWLRFAMGGRAQPEGNIHKGINVFLRGNLWDLGTDGTTVILNDSVTIMPKVNGGTLVNLWL